MTQSTLVLGTRGSALALRQARLVRSRLEDLGYHVELAVIRTTGDRILDVPLSDVGDKGLFTKELDLAVLDGTIHLAVHSLKDLPTRQPAGLTIAAVTEREDPRDAFIAHPSFSGLLADVPLGATLATASLRRRSQLKAWRADVDVVPVRGNVDTRLAKLDEGRWTGIVLAAAGLNRLGRSARITETIDTDVMLPAVGQGALAVVCAEEDEATRVLLRETIHDADVHDAVVAERALLRRLEGGCSVPVGGYAQVNRGHLTLEGCVADLDGRRVYRGKREGGAEEAEAIGTDLAEELLAAGADKILEEIRRRSV